MTTSALDMACKDIVDLYNIVCHEIKWLDKYYNVKPENPKNEALQGESRGLIVGITKVRHGPTQVIKIALVFTRTGLEIWKTYPDSDIERACEPLPNDWLRYMKGRLGNDALSVANEFIRLLPQPSGRYAKEIVKEGLRTAIADAIRSKTKAIDALTKTICDIA